MFFRILGRRVTPGILTLWLFGMAISVLWGMPLVWMVSTSLKPEGQIMRYPIEWLPRQVSWENYQIVFNYPVLRWFWNSLFVAVATTALVVLFSAMAGYALARMRFWGRGLCLWRDSFLAHDPRRRCPDTSLSDYCQVSTARYIPGVDNAGCGQHAGRLPVSTVFLFIAARTGGCRPNRWLRALSVFSSGSRFPWPFPPF